MLQFDMTTFDPDIDKSLLAGSEANSKKELGRLDIKQAQLNLFNPEPTPDSNKDKRMNFGTKVAVYCQEYHLPCLGFTVKNPNDETKGLLYLRRLSAAGESFPSSTEYNPKSNELNDILSQSGIVLNPEQPQVIPIEEVLK